MISTISDQYIKKTLTLAEQRRGFCAPNPAVGAVVVKNEKIIGSGAHQQCGEPHAEVLALQAAGEAARGATLYVSLEPCCHWGRTPPCSELIIQSGISAVYYAYRDPNPAVAGQGAEKLRAAGIDCHYVAMPEADDFYASYYYWTEHHRPRVTAKIALSLDSKIAGVNGQPLTITGVPLQQYTHHGRQHSDAL